MKNFSKLALGLITLAACSALEAQVFQYPQAPSYQQPAQQYVPGIQQPTYQQPAYQQPTYQQPGHIPSTIQPSYQQHAPNVVQASSESSLHWTQQFTENSTHDFGAVAKASKQVHVFEFENNLDTDLHLVGIQASCGCTIPTILTPTVKPGETARIQAKFDTLKFDGARGATLSVYVRKDAPYTEHGEVQFSVKGQIRRDVVLSPGAVEFSDVLKGKDSQRTISLMYAGNPEWQVKEVIAANPAIEVEVNETRRDAAARRVDYELVVKFNGEDEGLFRDNLTLVTNDLSNERISIDVSGRVLSVIKANNIELGILNQDQVIEKSMIIRGVRPFSITDIKTNHPAIEVMDFEGEKTMHLVKYRLDTSKVQRIEDTIQISTSDPLQEHAEISFSAQIVTGTFSGGDK